MLRYRGSTRPLLREGLRTVFNPNDLIALREKSAEVLFPITPETHAIVQRMFQVLQEKGSGAGLAAPQIGFKQRIILCSFDRTLERLEVMFNPRYEPIGTRKEERWEGCFSVPLSFATIDRWYTVRAFYRTALGDRVDKVLEGQAARIFQHECGHLEGELISDIAKDFKTFDSLEAYQAFLQVIRQEDAKTIAKP